MAGCLGGEPANRETVAFSSQIADVICAQLLELNADQLARDANQFNKLLDGLSVDFEQLTEWINEARGTKYPFPRLTRRLRTDRLGHAEIASDPVVLYGALYIEDIFAGKPIPSTWSAGASSSPLSSSHVWRTTTAIDCYTLIVDIYFPRE
jgi:hypothetical protein